MSKPSVSILCYSALVVVFFGNSCTSSQPTERSPSDAGSSDLPSANNPDLGRVDLGPPDIGAMEDIGFLDQSMPDLGASDAGRPPSRIYGSCDACPAESPGCFEINGRRAHCTPACIGPNDCFDICRNGACSHLCPPGESDCLDQQPFRNAPDIQCFAAPLNFGCTIRCEQTVTDADCPPGMRCNPSDGQCYWPSR